MNKQLDAVHKAVISGDWYTLNYLSALTGHPEASVSARLRDLRKVKYGQYTVERQLIPGSNAYAYRVTGGPL